MGRQWLQAKREVAGLKKGQAVGKLVKEIMVAAKLGGPDPDGNARLFAAIEKARRQSTSRDVIERAIKKGAGIGGEKLVMEHVVERLTPIAVTLLHLIEAKNEKARNTEWKRENPKRRKETHAEEAEGGNRPERARCPDETDAVEKLHVLWFLVASFMAHIWVATALDIVILSIGILWLWFRPGLAPALFLGLVQLGSLAYNAYLLTSNPVGSLAHKALTVHCIWRLIALLCLVAGYLKLRRERIAAASPPPLHEPV